MPHSSFARVEKSSHLHATSAVAHALRLTPRVLLVACAAVVVAAITTPREAAAQLIARESFVYPAGEILYGQTGGLGFSGPWIEKSYGDFDVIAEQALDHPTTPNAGLALKSTAPFYQYSELTRSLAAPITGAPGTVVWASFLLRKDSEGSFGPPDNFFGLVLYSSDPDPDADHLFIGDTGESDFYSLGIAGSDAGQAPSAHESVVSPSSTLLLVRIAFQEGPDVIDLFVNPDPNLGGSAVPAATKRDLDLADIGSIGLLAGYDAEWSVDEVTIGRLDIASIARTNAGGVRLNAAGVPGRTHRVLASSDLTQQFLPVESVVADANGNMVFDDPSAGAATTRFYRLAYP